MPKKKLPLSSLEKKLDRVFSIFIRKRHADEGGTVSCVTCGKLMHWTESHAGHFIKRQHRSTRWRPTNVHPQCPGDNTYRGGLQDEYARFIVQTYGLPEFNDLMESKHKVSKFTRSDLEDLIQSYQRKLEALEARMNFDRWIAVAVVVAVLATALGAFLGQLAGWFAI